jgi:2-polyprenyl-6-methoxyphenol hydroxylase-like FAD-dependent oxidoreductase
MLVDGLDHWPAHQVSLGTEGQLRYFVFPRAGGTGRLYLMYSALARAPFGGPTRVRDFLAAFRLRCIPDSAALFESIRAAGPYAAYRNTDSWTECPCAPGAVLIGDAAGWSDPITGQGLSIAMRDARTVADVLRAGSDWSPVAFAGYIAERAERMRRLRITAQVVTEMHSTFTTEGAARRGAWIRLSHTDPLLGGAEQAQAVGPENIAAESFEPATIQQIYALAG